jgi:hypothetical protein
MSWRGIPAQVTATDESGASVSRQLPAFFQQEIDRVAMAEGLIDTDDYLDGWAWSDSVEREGSAEEVADAATAEVAAAWRRAHELTTRQD